MTMYATKTWGFSPVDWPLVTFGNEGVRNRLLKLRKPGDTMLFIGTQGEPTDPAEQGRCLGYFEFTATPVITREVVDLKKRGVPDKWPFALLTTRAWRILEPPPAKELLPDLIRRSPGMTLAVGFGALTDTEEEAILSLPFMEEPIPSNPAAERAIAKTELIDGLQDRRGPKPGDGTSYSADRKAGSAATYLLHWKSRGIMKIGWAVDPTSRALELSKPLVPDLTEERWQIVLTEPWPEEKLAYLMEQAFVDALDQRGIRRSGEYFRPGSNAKLIKDRVWADAMIAAQEAYRRKDRAA